jgi:hypothetical protein
MTTNQHRQLHNKNQQCLSFRGSGGKYKCVKVKQSRYTPWRRLGERRNSSYSFSTSALGEGEWSASRHGRAFTPGERTPGTHWTGGWVGPRAGLDTEVTGKILCPCRGSNPDRLVVQSVFWHYTAWATPSHSTILDDAVSLTCVHTPRMNRVQASATASVSVVRSPLSLRLSTWTGSCIFRSMIYWCLRSSDLDRNPNYAKMCRNNIHKQLKRNDRGHTVDHSL